jgi:hypothetical protein|tara:strand:- start:126 stop:494 length:369 start_codon:yes stop_codon:yes gene_type:complete
MLISTATTQGYTCLQQKTYDGLVKVWSDTEGTKVLKVTRYTGNHNDPDSTFSRMDADVRALAKLTGAIVYEHHRNCDRSHFQAGNRMVVRCNRNLAADVIKAGLQTRNTSKWDAVAPSPAVS